MQKVFNVAVALCIAVLFMTPDHYKAIKHEFYQVWDSINEMKGVGKDEED